MIEIRNCLYIQRFFAESLRISDLWKAVTYSDYIGDLEKIPFWYKKTRAHTAHVDLSQNIEHIFLSIKSNVRNEIRRAVKEGCVVEYDNDYESFISFYNIFCEQKGIPELKTNLKTLKKYNYVLITKVKKGDVTLCAHATLIDEKSKLAMLMYSCSMRLCDDVNCHLVGWANRLLHFKEFELFKEMGMHIYEWNGVNVNPNEPEKNRIGKFKLGFGGEEEDIIMLQTPLFVFMKTFQSVLKRIKR